MTSRGEEEEEDWGETSDDKDLGDTKDPTAGAQDWGQMEWSADLEEEQEEEEEPNIPAGQEPPNKKQRVISDSALRTDLSHLVEKEEAGTPRIEAQPPHAVGRGSQHSGPASALRSGPGLIWRLPGDVLAEIGGLLLLNEFRLWRMTDKRSTTFRRNAPIVHIDHGLRSIFSGSRPLRGAPVSDTSAPQALISRLAYAVALTLENVLDCISVWHVQQWKATPWSRLHSLEITHFEKPADLSVFSLLMGALFAGIQERKSAEAKLSRRVEPFRKLVVRVPGTGPLVVNRMIEYKLDGPTEELALTGMDQETLKRLAGAPRSPHCSLSRLELHLVGWNTPEMAASLTAILVACPSLTSLAVTLSPPSAFYLPSYEFTSAMGKMNKRELREVVVTSNLTGRSQETWHTLQKACPKLQHFRVDDAPFEPEYSGTWSPVILYWNPREVPSLFRPNQLRVWLLQGHLFDAKLADKICREYKSIRDVRVVDKPIAYGEYKETNVKLGESNLDDLDEATDIPWHTFSMVLLSPEGAVADYWRLKKAKSFLSAHLSTLVDCQIPAVSPSLFSELEPSPDPAKPWPMKHFRLQMHVPGDQRTQSRDWPREWPNALMHMTKLFPLLETLTLNRCSYAVLQMLFECLPRLRRIDVQTWIQGDARPMIEWAVARLDSTRLFAVYAEGKRVQLQKTLSTSDPELVGYKQWEVESYQIKSFWRRLFDKYPKAKQIPSERLWMQNYSGAADIGQSLIRLAIA